MDAVSIRQYEKIFKSGGGPNNRSSQSVSAPVDKLHSSLTNAVKKVINLKLDDEEFDAATLNLDDIESYSTEVLYGVLSRKFGRMVQIVQEDEVEIEKLSEENLQLKEKLTEMIKYSEQLVAKARQEVQQLLDNNTKIHNENNLGKSDIQKMEALLSQKEEEINQLNHSQKQVIDEFVHLREKQQDMSVKNNEFNNIVAELRKNVEEAEGRTAEYETMCFDKQKELENLNKQRKVLETKLKQNTMKLNTLITTMKKKFSEQDKSIDEYKRVMEKNSLFVKKLADIEKDKETIKQEILQKNDELNHVRSLNEDYESRLSQLRGTENYVGLEQDKHYKLLTEQELLKQQINELAPHSLIDVTIKNEQTFDPKRAPGAEPASQGSIIDEEKYANLSPDEIQREINEYKEQLQQNQLKIDKLEQTNNDKIEKINDQRMFIEEFQNEYTDKIQMLNMTKTDCEEAMTEYNQVENDMEVLIRRFNLISETLRRGNNDEPYENENYERRLAQEYQDFEEEEEDDLEESTNGQKATYGHDNKSDNDYSPKPIQLHVSPNIHDRSGVKKSQQEQYDQEYDDSDEDRDFLKKRPKPQKSANSTAKKSPQKKH